MEDKIYLSVDKDPKGRGLLAVMTKGHPRYGDKNVIVLTIEVGFKNMKEAKRWYKKMLIEQPWELRN